MWFSYSKSLGLFLFIPFLCLNFIFIGLRRHKPWFWIFLIWSIGFSSTKYKVRIPREWYPFLIHYLTMLTNTLGSIFTCYIFADKTSFYGKTTGLNVHSVFLFLGKSASLYGCPWCEEASHSMSFEKTNV